MTLASKKASGARPRVGFDCHVLSGKPQGSATFLLNILRELARIECAFDVVLYCHDEAALQRLIGPSPFSYIELKPMGSLQRLMFAYPKQLRLDSIDLAVFQFVAPPFSSIPTLVVVHDLLPFSHPHLFPPFFRWSRQILFSMAIGRAYAIATVSEFSRAAISRYFPSRSDRVSVIGNGPTFQSDLEKVDAPLGGDFILAVGRIEKRKKIDLLVNAFVKANLSDVSLVIVGAFDLGYKIALPEHPRIIYLKNVPTPELAALYRQARLFVFPSEAEGFGIPVLDALLAGLPVIASNQTAIPEVTRKLAVLFNPTCGDAEQQLISLLKGHFEDQPISAPSEPKRVELSQVYSWQRSAQNIALLITRLVSEPHNGN